MNAILLICAAGLMAAFTSATPGGLATSYANNNLHLGHAVGAYGGAYGGHSGYGLAIAHGAGYAGHGLGYHGGATSYANNHLISLGATPVHYGGLGYYGGAGYGHGLGGAGYYGGYGHGGATSYANQQLISHAGHGYYH